MRVSKRVAIPVRAEVQINHNQFKTLDSGFLQNGGKMQGIFAFLRRTT
jgi:hypothetical protein